MNEQNDDFSLLAVGVFIIFIVIIFISWSGYNNFKKASYSKAWWSGTQIQRVCVLYNPSNRNCYDVSVYAEGGLIKQINMPNGGYLDIGSQKCGKALSFKGRYCAVTDTGGGSWQIEKNE